jgi:hypothetical protein
MSAQASMPALSELLPKRSAGLGDLSTQLDVARPGELFGLLGARAQLTQQTLVGGVAGFEREHSATRLPDRCESSTAMTRR